MIGGRAAVDAPAHHAENVAALVDERAAGGAVGDYQVGGLYPLCVRAGLGDETAYSSLGDERVLGAPYAGGICIIVGVAGVAHDIHGIADHVVRGYPQREGGAQVGVALKLQKSDILIFVIVNDGRLEIAVAVKVHAQGYLTRVSVAVIVAELKERALAFLDIVADDVEVCHKVADALSAFSDEEAAAEDIRGVDAVDVEDLDYPDNALTYRVYVIGGIGKGTQAEHEQQRERQ